MLPNLKRLRNEMGISQQRLADAIRVSQPSINKYENHNIEPEIEILCRIADFFNTSVDFLVGHTDIRDKIERTSPFDLNEQEAELIQCFRKLSGKEKHCILLTAKTFQK